MPTPPPAPSSRRARRAAPLLAAGLALALVWPTTGPATAQPDPGPSGETSSAAVAPVAVGGLRTENTVTPLGIDVERPRFSWTLTSTGRGVVQQSYRIVVATSAAAAAAGDGEVWDSGTVTSPTSAEVGYDGPALDPATRYHWAVRVDTGTAGGAAWSEPSWFETGLDPDGWSGSEWISSPAEGDDEPLDLAGARWVWHAETVNPPAAPAGQRYFRTDLAPAQGKSAESAEVLITADDGYRLFVNGEPVGASPDAAHTWMTAQRFEVELTGDNDVLAVEARNSWEAAGNQVPSPAGVLAKIRVKHTDGSSVVRRTDAESGWRSSTTAPTGWATPGFDDTAWTPVREHATYGSGPWGNGVTVPPGTDLQASLDEASWIWFADGTPPAAPEGTRMFRKGFEVDPTRTLTEAVLVMTADDRFTAWINGQLVGRSSTGAEAWRQAEIVPLTNLSDGANTIAVEAHNNKFASGANSPAGLLGYVRLTYDDGHVVLVPTDASWRSTQEAPAGWQAPGFDDAAWSAAVVHAPYGSGDWGSNVVVVERDAAPVLRREFDLDGDVASARLYVAGAGLVDARLNGAPVSDEVLSVSHTDYEERVHYATHDVTDALTDGPNALTFELGRGFYSMQTSNSWGWERAPWHQDDPAVRAVLRVVHTDGSTEVIGTDAADWRVTDGATTYDSLYEGDFYDARREPVGADTPGYDDGEWDRPGVVTGPTGALRARTQPPVRVTETLAATGITEPAPGVFVATFPRQVAGWARIHVEGKVGDEVQLRYGERLLDGGRVNSSTGFTGGDFQTDRYTLAGRPGGETWEPKFSYKGFRFVEITGWPGDGPELGDIEARVVHTDVAETSSFSSSEPLFDQIHRGAVDTMLNNLHHIPTDTPTYEKNGWTGDAQLGAQMFLRNFDIHPLLTKWLDDVSDSRHADGRPALIAPDPDWDWGVNMQSPTWHAAYVLIPWWMYEETGDRRVIEEHFDGILDYLRLEHSTAVDHISSTGLGDYMSPDQVGNPPEDMRVSATAYVYEMTRVAADMADLLDRPADAAELREEAAEIRTAFNAAFYDADAGVYRDAQAGYRQTHNVLAVAFGLVPDGDVQRVVDNLARDISEERDDHLWTGVLGTKYLLPLLTEHGHGDLAYRVATQTDYPSWGRWFESAEGSTSMWEAWDDYRSRNHYFLGTIDDWFFEDLAGITPTAPGYRTISVAPQLVGDLTRAAGSVRTPLGEVSSSWTLTGGELDLDVEVPPGATAVVSVPVAEGQVVDAPTEAEPLGTADGRADFRVGSGEWSFGAGDPVVDPVASTTTVTAPAVVRKGGSVDVAVQVRATGAEPTGSVVVWSGERRLGSVPLSAGRAVVRVATKSLPVGQHTLRAVYGGDAAVAGSQATTRLRVLKALSRTRATAPGSVRRGKVATIKARVAAVGLAPTGRVVLMARDRQVGSARVVAGVTKVRLRTGRLPLGRVKVRVVYRGSADVQGSSATVWVRVRR
ncbi:family 78 glycoside hydrolase catalytic domain [Nocardioides sp. SYSU D00038]|uniref:family 78 glycoside hydrolase catalytic domain n=1 Tax=Nocardioides sp. SYSU D00038 TaxID=2812554 RepID=UPI00196789F0|nr:family 78 glycoside hydrolase catalytic domain [Nocardioides sp. SYSU D00038]